MYARQEAVLSSQIEGTQSTLSDLLLFESGGTTLANDADVQTVHNYQAAKQYGLERLKSGFPLSLRLLREIHTILIRDTNGRVGRLLITFMLCADGTLSQPLLYLSLFLKQHRDVYYNLLQNIRTKGAWEEWLQFYLEGVEVVATQATQTTRRLVDLFESDRKSLHQFRGRSSTLLKVHEFLKHKAAVSISDVANQTGMSFPTAATALNIMCSQGMIREITQRQRDRVFLYQRYIDILSEGVTSAESL